ncbi:MAG: hypothetical protein Q7J68_05775, partial [Thermoplasmata archaeon]|nr:hypothetical protein [Thermoplasmata archaeon]
MVELHVKGVHLANVFRFVKWKRGLLGLTKFNDEIRKLPECSKLDENSFVEKDWYDYELYLKLLNIADKVVGTGDLSKIYEIGLWNIRNLGHLSYLAMKPEIHDFMNNAVKNWRSVYDFGSLEVVENTNRKIVVRYMGFPPAPEKCQYFRGSITGMIELCGLDGKCEQTACNVKGA